MALKPITRQEQIIAGKELEPITRMEKFLKEYGGGSGGSSGPADWNTMLNKPFYEEVTETAVPLDISWDGDTTGKEIHAIGTASGVTMYLCRISDLVLTLEDLSAGTLDCYSAEGSASYVVGTDVMPGDLQEVAGVEGACILADGNPLVASLPVDGLFAGVQCSAGTYFLYVEDSGTPVMYVIRLSNPDAVITTRDEVIHKIDNKYIDAEWMATKSVEKDVVLLEGAIEKLSTNGHAFSGFGPEDVVASGGAVTVTWNGTEYVCPLREGTYNGAKMAWIGNCYEHPLLGRLFGSDTGEPFLFGFGITAADGLVQEGCMIHAVNSGDESAEFTIKGNRVVPNQMPEEFLPDNVFAPSFNLALAGFPNIPRNGGSVSAKLDVTKDIIQALQKGPVWITAKITFGEYINEVTMLIFATQHGPAGLCETYAWGLFDEEYCVVFKFEYSDAWDGTWTTTAWGRRFNTDYAYRMYLKSETSGKTFKITVDDSGTLSATEVTS